MSKKIDYSSDFFNVLSTLSGINPSALFLKHNGKLCVGQNSESSAFGYIVRAPISHFDFGFTEKVVVGREEQIIPRVGFGKLAQFTNIIKNYPSASVEELDDATILIKEGRTKFRIRVTTGKHIRKSIDLVQLDSIWPQSDFSVDIDAGTLATLRGRADLVEARLIEFRSSGNDLFIRAFSKEHSNEWADSVEGKSLGEEVQDFPIMLETLKYIPKGSDVTLNISNAGLVWFNVKMDNEIELTILAQKQEIYKSAE